jgi:hypothetical protein
VQDHGVAGSYGDDAEDGSNVPSRAASPGLEEGTRAVPVPEQPNTLPGNPLGSPQPAGGKSNFAAEQLGRGTVLYKVNHTNKKRCSGGIGRGGRSMSLPLLFRFPQ